MRKRLASYLVSVLVSAMVTSSLPVNPLTVLAAGMEESVSIETTVSNADVPVYLTAGMDEQSGTFGDNNGFRWSYDESSATLTVTGEDSGLNQLRSVLPDAVLEGVKDILFQDGHVSGSLQELLMMQGNVERVEFQNFDTSNVTNMNKMFYMCSKLSAVNVNGINTSNVTDMAYMFVDCSSLSTVDVSNFNTSKVTDMQNMFAGCSKLTGLDVSGFDTSNVTNMRNMFAGCSKLADLNVSNFDTSNVTDMYAMFYNCSSITNLELSNFDTSNVTDMKDLFKNCKGLVKVDVSSFDTSNVTDMGWMFSNCSSLESLDLSSFNTGKVTGMWEMFYGCSKLKSVDVSNFNTSEVITMNGMFYNCSSLKSVDVSRFDTGKLTDISGMFLGCKSLEKVDLSTFDTSNVTEMGNLFLSCSNLKSADISSFDTSKVDYMGGMFLGCENLEMIKTPKNMLEGQVMSLPDVFFDSEKNGLSEITSAYCNQTLLKQEMEYTITYHLAGGKNTAGNPASYTKSSATIILKVPTKTGYTFSGWYSDSSYKNKVTKINAGSTGELNLYAKWTPNKYTIKFAGNGANGGKMNSLTNLKYDADYKLTANAYKRKGYTFTGWNTKAAGKGIAYKNQAKVKNLTSVNGKTVTLYAQWKKDTYKINYKLNGGKNHKNNPVAYTVTSAVITLKKPTRTGYAFSGWYSDSKYKTKVTKIIKGSTGNKILYAKWTPNKYTIKFNGNGATSGKMSSLNNRKYGTSYKLTANAFKKKGYTFAGWNTKKNGRGTTYKNKANVKNLTATNGKTITLYAQWKMK